MNQQHIKLDPDRKFVVQADLYMALLTVKRRTGEQIMALVEPYGFYVAHFNQDGEFLREEKVLASTELHANELRQVNLAVFASTMNVFQDELGQNLELQRFQTECGYGISDLTFGMIEELENVGGEFTTEDIEETIEDIHAWLEAGYYALRWPDEYYVNRKGKIESN